MSTLKQLQKRATHPFQKDFSGFKLRGIAPTYDANNLPTVSLGVAAGGASVDVDLTSGNLALFSFIRIEIYDRKGNKASGTVTGATLTLDTSAIDTGYNPGGGPAISAQVVFQLLDAVSLDDNNPVLDYAKDFDAATWLAGFTYDFASELNTTKNGLVMTADAVYDPTPASEKITVSGVALAAAGTTVEIFENAVSLGTTTLDAVDGSYTFEDAGVRAPGDYTYKVIVTTAGAAFGSFVEVTITVA